MAVYGCLVRAEVIDRVSQQRRQETWVRWERGAPVGPWQLGLVHGFLLADGTSAKALTRVEDHSSDAHPSPRVVDVSDDASWPLRKPRG